MIGLLLALYPVGWRRRYGEEFRAVLESRPLGPFDVADVLFSAIDARFRAPRSSGATITAGGHLVMLRIGGFGAIGGGALWFVGIAFASWLGEPDGAPWMFVSMAGTIGLLAALIGLSAFQAHRAPALAWAAFLIPATGMVVSLIGMFGMATSPSDVTFIGTWSPWGVWMLGTLATLVGSILFAAASIRAGVFSSRAAKALAVAAATIIIVAMGGVGITDSGVATIVIAVVLAAFAGSWMALGFSAVRRGPIRAVVSG